jgi:hydrogenase expression/formation protein HypC
MCVSIPGRVTSINNHQAEIDVLGAQRRASTQLLPGVKLGDYVLTNAGMIVEILDEDEAQTSIALFQEIMALSMLEEDEEEQP